MKRKRGWLATRLNSEQFRLYGLLILTSLLLSIGGILYAAYISKQCVDGQRGGALSIVASLFTLFLRSNYGERVYRSVLRTNPKVAAKIEALQTGQNIVDFDNHDLTRLIIGILGRINVEADEQRKQNLALFCASLIGTLTWGFGDWVAQMLGHCKM